jgi:hypothetical protein
MIVIIPIVIVTAGVPMIVVVIIPIVHARYHVLYNQLSFEGTLESFQEEA